MQASEHKAGKQKGCQAVPGFHIMEFKIFSLGLSSKPRCISVSSSHSLKLSLIEVRRSDSSSVVAVLAGTMGHEL